MKSKPVYCQQCGKEGSKARLDGQGEYSCKACFDEFSRDMEMESAEINLHDCYYYQDSDH